LPPTLTPEAEALNNSTALALTGTAQRAQNHTQSR